MPEPDPCEALQRADQMYCVRCSLTWDMNDPDPPGCPLRSVRSEVAAELFEVRNTLRQAAAHLDATAVRIFNAGREYERRLNDAD